MGIYVAACFPKALRLASKAYSSCVGSSLCGVSSVLALLYLLAAVKPIARPRKDFPDRPVEHKDS